MHYRVDHSSPRPLFITLLTYQVLFNKERTKQAGRQSLINRNMYSVRYSSTKTQTDR